MVHSSKNKRIISFIISFVLIFNLFGATLSVNAEELKDPPICTFDSTAPAETRNCVLSGANGSIYFSCKTTEAMFSCDEVGMAWMAAAWEGKDNIVVKINGVKATVAENAAKVIDNTYLIRKPREDRISLQIKIPYTGEFIETKDLLEYNIVTIDVPGYKTLTLGSNNKKPIQMTADSTHNLFSFNKTVLSDNLELTFTDDADWRNAITDIKIDDTSIFSQTEKYSIQAGKIILDKSFFASAKDYNIVVLADGYAKSSVTQTINEIAVIVKTQDVISHKAIEFEFLKTIDVKKIVSAKAYRENNSANNLNFTVDADKNTLTVDKYNTTTIETTNTAKFEFRTSDQKIYTCNLVVPDEKTPKYLYMSIDENKNKIGDKIQVNIGYDESNAKEVKDWVSNIFEIRQMNQVLPFEYSDDGVGEIALTIDTTALYNVGTISFKFYAEGYSTLYSSLKVEPVANSPKLSHDNQANFYRGEDLIIGYSNDDQQYYQNWYNNLVSVNVSGTEIDFKDSSKITFEPASKTIVINSELIKNCSQRFNVSFVSKGYATQTLYASFLSAKPSPTVSPMSDATVGNDVALTYSSNQDWKNGISEILVDGKILSSEKYTLENGKITILSELFPTEKQYSIKIKAQGFEDVNLTQGVGNNASKNSFNADKYSTQTALNIIVNGKTIEISERQLYELTASQGNIAYNISSYNTWPTFETSTFVFGPTINGILELAGVKTSELKGDQVIKITSGADGFSASFTVDKLINTDRYYFPNAGKASSFLGSTMDSKNWINTYDNSVIVPALIELGASNGTLKIGQSNPQEQQKDACVKYLISTSKPGTIEIKDETAEKFNQVTPSVKNGSNVEAGKVLDFKSTNGRAGIYYTVGLNGEIPKDPTELDTMYNYAQFLDQKHNSYVFTSEPTIIKVRVIGRWGLDSDVMTLYYNGAQPSVAIDVNGNSNLEINKDELKEAVLTQEDKEAMLNGADAKIKVNFNKVINAEDAEFIVKALNGKEYKGILFFNLDIVKEINGKEENVTELSSPITIKVPIPEELVGLMYDFSIVRVHNGVVTMLKTTVSPDGKYLIFESDLFSTYAIVYGEKTLNNTTAIEDNQTPKADTPQNNNVKTQDETQWIAISSIALTTALGVAIVSKKRKSLVDA